MERHINFWRDRWMLCADRNHRYPVGLDWFDRWEQGKENCPVCGRTSVDVEPHQVTVDPADLALDGARIAQLFWYHTSTYQDWPPAIEGIDGEVSGAQAKALHVGTFEAAVHNMLRRMDMWRERDRQFYLYRVHLRPDIVVREDWIDDPSNYLGDVRLDEVCPPGIDVTRYLNTWEDPGGLSLALARDAISNVQQVSVPLSSAASADWLHEALKALDNASDDPISARNILGKYRPGGSERMTVARELTDALAGRVPFNLRDQFNRVASLDKWGDLQGWSSRAVKVFDFVKLVNDPKVTLAKLESAPIRYL